MQPGEDFNNDLCIRSRVIKMRGTTVQHYISVNIGGRAQSNIMLCIRLKVTIMMGTTVQYIFMNIGDQT